MPCYLNCEQSDVAMLLYECKNYDVMQFRIRRNLPCQVDVESVYLELCYGCQAPDWMPCLVLH